MALVWLDAYRPSTKGASDAITMTSVDHVSSSEGRTLELLLATANVVDDHHKNPTKGRVDQGIETKIGGAYPTPSSMAAVIDRMATICSEQFSAFKPADGQTSATGLHLGTNRAETLTNTHLHPSMDHAWEARVILWVVHVRHVILARFGYNWHAAVDLGYIIRIAS